ncbi:ABC transporter permease [Stenotrophomonas sp.]|uniref:ABC transporter permease n=1 Tax=Stenotrophomonas sp. TaxID=69392 RepID=UPI0028A88FD5|nr:ABC transporter permease [Stenotrophomonas sp.]
MNAVHNITPLGKFKWLLKREYWENRGGFVWAQVITGGIAILFASIGALIGVFAARSSDGINHTGDASEYLKVMGAFGDGLLLAGIFLASLILAFVVFFYALGSLYDDRRDRSVLFWKSLPVSDTQTVLSKAAWALVLAPLIAMAIGLAVGLVLWVVAMLGAAGAGATSPWAIATHSHPFRILALVLGTLPISLLWALPTVGWLMFCSALVRSKPFLWAVLLPLLACTMLSILGAMPGVKLPLGWIWYTVAYRGLLSVFPSSWLPRGLTDTNLGDNDMQTPADLVQWLLQHHSLGKVVSNPDIWIGAIVGIALIVAAIYLRRRRDDI